MFYPFLAVFLSFFLNLDTEISHEQQIFLTKKQPLFLNAQSDQGSQALDSAFERAQEVGDSDWTDNWAIKLLILGEGAVIFWLYKLIKDEEKQRQVFEGIQNIWNRENSDDAVHRRFALLLNAIGEEVLYVAQGDLKSVLKLSKSARLLLFFKKSNNEDDIYFIEKIENDLVYFQNSAKEKMTIAISEFFSKSKFSFIVFLSKRDFCEICPANFMNLIQTEDQE